MYKQYYIQFSTDFHLLAALASINDLSNSNITLIGPSSEMVRLLCNKITVQHHSVDPRTPEINLQEFFWYFVKAKSSKNHVIISPFVFPLYSYFYLLKIGVVVRKIIRTDEGVGTYASIRHYYNAYRSERLGNSMVHCFFRAILKKITMQMTVLFGLSETKYIFSKKLKINQQQINKIIRNIQIVGKLDELNGEVIYVSQPNVENNFYTLKHYMAFIRRLGRDLGSNSVIIKKHPSDKLDYGLFGFKVLQGLPLEIYNVKDSIVFGFSSTALLTAKIIGECNQVYYLNILGGMLTYDCLSDFNKQLFDLYLTSLDCTPKDVDNRLL